MGRGNSPRHSVLLELGRGFFSHGFSFPPMVSMNESNIGNLLLTDQFQENDDPETWSCRFGGSLMGVSSWACY